MKENHWLQHFAEQPTGGEAAGAPVSKPEEGQALLRALRPVLRELFGLELEQVCEHSTEQLLELARTVQAAGTGAQRHDAMQERFARLKQQFRQVQQLHPQAQLCQELDNPAFVRLLRHGLDAQSAYRLVHFRELTQGAVAYGANRAREELTAAMQAGYLRPRESGLETGSSPFAEGAQTWSKKTRDELKTRARRGETIRL